MSTFTCSYPTSKTKFLAFGFTNVSIMVAFIQTGNLKIY